MHERKVINFIFVFLAQTYFAYFLFLMENWLRLHSWNYSITSTSSDREKLTFCCRKGHLTLPQLRKTPPNIRQCVGFRRMRNSVFFFTLKIVHNSRRCARTLPTQFNERARDGNDLDRKIINHILVSLFIRFLIVFQMLHTSCDWWDLDRFSFDVVWLTRRTCK